MAPIASDWNLVQYSSGIDVFLIAVSAVGLTGVLLTSIFVCVCCKKKPVPEEKKMPRVKSAPKSCSSERPRSIKSGQDLTPSATPRAMMLSVSGQPAEKEDVPSLTLQSYTMVVDDDHDHEYVHPPRMTMMADTPSLELTTVKSILADNEGETAESDHPAKKQAVPIEMKAGGMADQSTSISSSQSPTLAL